MEFNRIRKMAKNFNNSSPFYTITITLNNALFFVLWSKFRITKQIVVTFVATTFKALRPISTANGWFPGCKFYTGNIYYSFRNILAHISPCQNIKRCAAEATHRKTQTPIAATQTEYRTQPFGLYSIRGICVFTAIIRMEYTPKKGIVILSQKTEP